jgi:hypothetical protein
MDGVHFVTERINGKDHPILKFIMARTTTTEIVGGDSLLEPQGYGCFIFICQWAKGDNYKSNTCDWDVGCENGLLFKSGEVRKTGQMDYRVMIDEAKKNSACCSTDSSCGCNLKGIATLTNSKGQYARVSMDFLCNLNTYVCRV